MTTPTLPMLTNSVREYLPHRYPFLLVDRVIDLQENESITAIKNITINEPFFNGHFPELPILPGVLIVEALAQTAGILAFIMQGKKPADGVSFLFAGADKVKFKRKVVPGDQITLHAKLTFQRGNIFKFSCLATVDNSTAASVDIIISQQLMENLQ